jgi:hypothetical protein
MEWKYLIKTNTKVTCNSDSGDCKYGSDYHGCCKDCVFRQGKYGDHWTSDKVWCESPVRLKKGQTIEVIEIKKYKIT